MPRNVLLGDPVEIHTVHVSPDGGQKDLNITFS